MRLFENGVKDKDYPLYIKNAIKRRDFAVDSNCAICLDDFDENTALPFPCFNHVAHASCLKSWKDSLKEKGI